MFSLAYISTTLLFLTKFKKKIKTFDKNVRIILLIKHYVEIFQNVFELFDRCFARAQN